MISTVLGRAPPSEDPCTHLYSWVNWESDPEREIRGGNRTAVVNLTVQCANHWSIRPSGSHYHGIIDFLAWPGMLASMFVALNSIYTKDVLPFLPKNVKKTLNFE